RRRLAHHGRLHRSAAGRRARPVLGDRHLHADRPLRLAALAAVMVLVVPMKAGAARPPVALIASPAHGALARSGRSVVTVTNSGTEDAVVDVLRAGYGLDLRGRPRVVARRASWLAVVPARLTLASGESKSITVVSRLPRRAQPGDHPELVLF